MCLHEVGISNHSYSNYREDGLILFNTYLTLALKCVPPGDKPTREELYNCSYFLKNEMDIINNIKVILCLGKIAFDSILQYYKTSNIKELKSFKFSHGAEYLLPDGKLLVGCYHPSPRNVNTKKINKEKLVNLLKIVFSKESDELTLSSLELSLGFAGLRAINLSGKSKSKSERFINYYLKAL